MPYPEAVTFDCWSTLIYEEDWAVAHTLRVRSLWEAAAEAGLNLTEDVAERAFELAWGRHMELWCEGEATGAVEVARWALADLGIDPGGDAFDHLVRAFEEAGHSGRVRAIEGALQTLELLTAGGVRTALICDTGLTPGRVVRRHLDRLGLLTHLEVQVFSDEVGVPKPDPRVFHTALRSLDVAPTQAVHVGDLRRTDVAGARGVGMRSVRLRSHHDDTAALLDADYVAGSHAELCAILGLAVGGSLPLRE